MIAGRFPIALALSLVVAAGPATTYAATTNPAVGSTTDTGGSDRRLSELFYQLQVLQQEVQELRGLVEEQSYQLNRLARDQKEQYIDLDRRVAALGTGTAVGSTGGYQGAAPGPSTTPGASTGGLQPSTVYTAPTASPGTTAATTGTGAVAALPGVQPAGSEREAYQQAFDLMKARRFDESVDAFNQLVVAYPNGQYTPNAFYWLGELYLAQQADEQARQSFMQVLNLYPDHPKVPDTLYKLGVAYHRLGDRERAMDYFSQVQTRYPQSSAAGLAASYAQEIR